MKKYLNSIKYKNLFFFISIILIMITAIFVNIFVYMPGFISNKLTIILISLIIGFIIVNFLFYGLLGFTTSVSISLFSILMLTFFKLLEINFSWNIYAILLFGIILVNNNCLFLLEKIRFNFIKKWGMKKSFETTQIYNFNSNIDKNMIIFIFGAFMFLFNDNIVSTIGAVFVILSVLSFIITLINQNLIKILVGTKIKKEQNLWFGLSSKIKINNKYNIFNSKIKYIKYLMWLISALGLIILSIFVLVDELGTDLFHSSSVVQNMSKEVITKGILSILFSLFAIFIYISIRHRWNFALTLLYVIFQDLVLLLALFVIMRMTINPFFVASVLITFIYSTVFSIDHFKILKNKIEIHVGEIDKNILYKKFDYKIKSSFLRLVIMFYFMLITLLVFWIESNQDIFIMGVFLGFIVTIISSKIITPVILIKFELLRLKYVTRRTKNNFWKTYGKEEQIINGINDYKI